MTGHVGLVLPWLLKVPVGYPLSILAREGWGCLWRTTCLYRSWIWLQDDEFIGLFCLLHQSGTWSSVVKTALISLIACSYMIAMWLLCGCFVDALWLFYGCYVVAMWLIFGCYAVAIWLPCGCYLVAMQLPWGLFVVAKWLLCGCYAVAMQLLCSLYVVVMQLFCGCNQVALWLVHGCYACGCYVFSMCLLCCCSAVAMRLCYAVIMRLPCDCTWFHLVILNCTFDLFGSIGIQ